LGPRAMATALIRKCATALRRLWRRRHRWDVVADGVAVGRIFLSPTAPEHRPWMLKLSSMVKDMGQFLYHNPNASKEDLARMANRISNSIDNRFGEAVRDNLGMNKEQCPMLDISPCDRSPGRCWGHSARSLAVTSLLARGW
jgi:hypothetical protein